jgi:hypothetical protein
MKRFRSTVGTVGMIGADPHPKSPIKASAADILSRRDSIARLLFHGSVLCGKVYPYRLVVKVARSKI